MLNFRLNRCLEILWEYEQRGRSCNLIWLHSALACLLQTNCVVVWGYHSWFYVSLLGWAHLTIQLYHLQIKWMLKIWGGDTYHWHKELIVKAARYGHIWFKSLHTHHRIVIKQGFSFTKVQNGREFIWRYIFITYSLQISWENIMSRLLQRARTLII